MIDLGSFKLEVSVSKNKRNKTNRTSNEEHQQLTKLINGKVILVDDIWKCEISYNDIIKRISVGVNISDITDNSNDLIISFTEDTFDLKDKPVIFTRSKERGKYICVIRNHDKCLAFPGDINKYIPFALNWIIRGWIVKINGKILFKFRNCVTIENLDSRDSIFNIKNQKEDEEIKWKMKERK